MCNKWSPYIREEISKDFRIRKEAVSWGTVGMIAGGIGGAALGFALGGPVGAAAGALKGASWAGLAGDAVDIGKEVLGKKDEGTVQTMENVSLNTSEPPSNTATLNPVS